MAEEEEVLVEDRGDLVEGEVLGEDETSDEEDEELEPEAEEDEDQDKDEDAEEDEGVSEDDEDEDSSEEDESETTDEGEDEEDPDDTGNQRVPRSRLNQVIQQREDERARATWLEEQLETLIGQRQAEVPVVEVKVEPDYDFDDAEERYGNFLLEGDTKQATAVRKEMNGERDKLYQKQIDDVKVAMKEEATAVSKATLEDNKFETFLEKTFEARDYLDDSSDQYNERAVKMANSLMVSYIQEGKSKVEALTLAVEDISPLFEEKPKLGSKKKTTTRTKDARRKAVKTDEQQPPSGARKSRGKGTRDLDNFKVEGLSDKDFNSLTKKELATLRGD